MKIQKHEKLSTNHGNLDMFYFSFNNIAIFEETDRPEL